MELSRGFRQSEMEIVLGYMFGFQEMPSEFYHDTQTKRPWTPFERFQLAFREIIKKEFKGKKFEFSCCRYDEETNKLTAFAEPPLNEVKQSKRLFDAAMNWDESVLTECLAKSAPKLTALGFKAIDRISPMELQRPLGVYDIDELEAKSSEAPRVHGDALGQVVKQEKPRRTLSPEHLAALQAGRDKKKLAKTANA